MGLAYRRPSVIIAFSRRVSDVIEQNTQEDRSACPYLKRIDLPGKAAARVVSIAMEYPIASARLAARLAISRGCLRA